MDEVYKDKRFSHIHKDPRFRKVPKNHKKVKLDKRFAGMFDENGFNETSKLDERGRVLELKPTENLKKLYNTTNVSSEDEEDTTTKDSSKEKSLLKKIEKKKTKKVNKKKAEVNEGKSLLKPETKLPKKKENTRISSKLIDSSTNRKSSSEDYESEDFESEALDPKQSEESESSEESDESDSSSNENDSVQGDFDHHWEEFDEEAKMAEDIFRRLAVCNMDWDRIRASDLFVVFNSFKPESGTILSVKIYPSEFGLKRMEEEKLKGPLELVEKTLASDEEEDVEDKKGAKYNQEKLRQYQINRLKYYYAIAECDSAETANHLYEQLNGMEYESSSVRFDLRFVPDETTFDQEPISVADSSPDPTEYKPRLFVTTALQQVKVNLTWDETDPHRRETLQRAFTDLDSAEKDLKDYIAFTSSEESEVEPEVEENKKLSSKERIAKYRALLLDLEEKEKKDKFEKEIRWDPDLKEKTQQIVKEKFDSTSTSTPFDEILKKKKEKRKEKKQKGKIEMNNEDKEFDSEDSDLISDKESSKQSTKQLAELQLISDTKEIVTSQEKKKGKRFKKKKKEQKKNEFECNVTDPRFSAIYTCHDYNIDPSDPHFKNTEGSIAIIKEKQKRKLHEKDLPEERKSKKNKHC